MTTGSGDPTVLSAGDAGVGETQAEAYCSACNQSFGTELEVCPHDGARLIQLAAERDELIGKVLDERYQIRAPLGKGGMGTVYRGWQLSVDREVAIKVIHPRLAGDRSAVKRFLREARLASRLGQPNIVNVYDFGQSGGVLYLVMELLRGHMLGSELGRGRHFDPRRTVAIASQLCDALEAAHAQGIVHRDLKPSNIVILDDPPGRDLIKVLDFGLAKSLTQADTGSVVTNTDALLGTPLYMAPEQIEGKPSDPRADLYSLGCILYEMLTGAPPFVDAAVSAVLARHIHETHAPLPAHLPPRLRALVDQLLVKVPEGRVQTAGEVRRVLDELRDGGTGSAALDRPAIADTMPEVDDPFAVTHAAPTPVGLIIAPPSTSASPPAVAPRRRYGVIAVLVLVPLAALLVVFRPTREPTPAPASSSSSDFALDPTSAKQAGPVLSAAPDGGVELADAASAPTGVEPTPRDAAVTSPPNRPQTTPVRRPRTPGDAGVNVELPDLDFVKPK